MHLLSHLHFCCYPAACPFACTCMMCATVRLGSAVTLLQSSQSGYEHHAPEQHPFFHAEHPFELNLQDHLHPKPWLLLEAFNIYLNILQASQQDCQ